MTEDEMVGWHHRLNGREFEQALGDKGQGSLVCCSLWSYEELGMTERLNNNNQGLNPMDTFQSWFYCCLFAQSCPTLLRPQGLTVAFQDLCPWDFLGKNTGVSCHFLLQVIFPTQGLNP